LKTRDGRFSYEAAGDPDAPPLVFLHGIGGAARAWRGQLDYFADGYHCIAWDMPGYGGSAPLPSVSIASLADALQDFLHATGADKPVLVGHSIGGMIVQQLLTDEPLVACAVVLAQTSPAFGKPDGDWQKQFINVRLGPLDRGETLASLAPSLVKELVGDDPDPAGLALARDCMAAIQSPPCAEGDFGADAGVVGIKGQQRAGADDGEDGELYSERDLCRARRRRPSRQPRTPR
jgi:3-oxoadipate enol-lactonase